MESFGELLNEYLRRLGVSDSERARTVGGSRQTIFRWREGRTGRPRRREDVLVIVEKLRLTAEERDKLLLAAGFRPEEAVPLSEPASMVVPEPEPEIAELAPTGELATERRRRWPLAAGVATIVVLALFLFWWLALRPPDDTQKSSAATATPQKSETVTLAPAVTGEQLIVVLRSEATASGQRWTAGLAEALQREAHNNRLTTVRVAELVSTIEPAVRAQQVGSQMGSAGVVYVDFSGDRPMAHLFNLSLAAEAELAWVELEFDRHRPLQSRALALLALSQLYLVDHSPEQMVLLLAQAHTALQDDGQAPAELETLVVGLLCRACAYAGQGEPALAYCQQADEADGRPVFWEARGMAHALLGDHAAAVDDWDACLDLWPSDGPEAARIQDWIDALAAGQDPLTPAVLTERWLALGQ